jgi:hypothetical protein
MSRRLGTASAPEVLKETMREANLLISSPSLGTPENIRALLRLAETALDAGDGGIPNQEVLAAPLHWTSLGRLGLTHQ